MAQKGIGSYALRETCIHRGDQAPVTIKTALYKDLRNLGSLFQKEKKAEALIEQMKETLTQVQRGVKELQDENLRVFVFDSGPFNPFTIGGLTVFNDVLFLTGGQNIFHKERSSWFQTTWENVSLQNPDIIIVVDYGDVDGALKLKQLKDNPLIKKTKAFRYNRFILVPYAAALSGIRSASSSLNSPKENEMFNEGTLGQKIITTIIILEDKHVQTSDLIPFSSLGLTGFFSPCPLRLLSRRTHDLRSSLRTC